MSHKPVFLIAFLFTMIAQAQTPGRPEWNVLAKESTAIVTGTVTEGKLWVIDPNKRRSDSTNIPNPADFVIGRIIHLKVDDALLKDGKAKVGSVIEIFVPGWMSTEGMPAFVPGQRYAVFLSPLKAEKNQFAGTARYQPGTSFGQEKSFDPSTSYAVVRNAHGVVPLTAENSKIQKEIRAIFKQH